MLAQVEAWKAALKRGGSGEENLISKQQNNTVDMSIEEDMSSTTISTSSGSGSSSTSSSSSISTHNHHHNGNTPPISIPINKESMPPFPPIQFRKTKSGSSGSCTSTVIGNKHHAQHYYRRHSPLKLEALKGLPHQAAYGMMDYDNSGDEPVVAAAITAGSGSVSPRSHRSQSSLANSLISSYSGMDIGSAPSSYSSMTSMRGMLERDDGAAASVSSPSQAVGGEMMYDDGYIPARANACGDTYLVTGGGENGGVGGTRVMRPPRLRRSFSHSNLHDR